MKLPNLFSALLVGSLAAGLAHGATYDFAGTQTSYTITIPGYPGVTAEHEPEPSRLVGTFYFDLTAPTIMLSGVIEEHYHNVKFRAWDSSTAVLSSPGNEYRIYSQVATFDEVTRTLTASVTARAVGVAPFCVGNVKICAGVYTANQDLPVLDLILTFDSTLSDFVGIGSYTKTLANGTIISEQFVFDSEVPLPAAAWLFGSGLVGLGGLVRRRRLVG